jgi:predicted ATPase
MAPAEPAEPADGYGLAEDASSAAPPSGYNGDELRQIFARECSTWEPMVLEPEAMRRPFPGSDRAPLSVDGSNLAAVLHRLGPDDLSDIEADLAAVVPNSAGLRTLWDDRRGEYDFDVRFRNTGWTSPPMLSDGTLRVLALLTAWYDEARAGLLAVEEIENGLHPTRIADLVRRLRRDVDEFSNLVSRAQRARGFRQLLATTHSPVLLSALRHDSTAGLVFLEQVSRANPLNQTVSTVTKARPLRDALPGEGPGDTVSADQVERLLESIGQVAG